MTATKKPATLAERLAHARNLSADLNASTDKLNASLEVLERKFRELDLGVEASIDLTSDWEREGNEWRRLCFEKVGGGWRFSIVTGNEAIEPNFDSTPLLKASRAWRLEAAMKMDALLEEMINEAERQIDMVNKAALGVDLLASTIEFASKPKRAST
ncbi:MAG: hypothetical protein KF764_13590 [Labilithrix sp.]|nr:hypothetical protein [Labilithrix sp.]